MRVLLLTQLLFLSLVAMAHGAVLSTAPQKYVVVDPEGHIRARCYVDIVIRINDVSSQQQQQQQRSDEFRVCMFQQASGIESLLRSSTSSLRSSSSSSAAAAAGLVSGHRDVPATLYAVRPAAHLKSGDGKAFESMPGSSSNLTQSQIFSTSAPGSPTGAASANARQIAGLNANRSPTYFLILMSVAAAVVLMMPNSDAEKPSLMSFLPLPGLHMKLCAAYVLGCITKPLFWP